MKRSSILCVLSLLVLIFGIVTVQAGEAVRASGPVLPKNLRHISFVGADGSSCRKAVVVRNAANNLEGVAAEKAWIAWKYPNAKVKGQGVSGVGNKTFDSLEIETASGEAKTICFDITDFFGQW
ncbi:MAG: hypothetical protein P9E24_07415 [Candidatus Competibacter sp.]|nr:hypothetical protein [Candidatus Competibacter sp.]MDG4584755.1 hypothetical protein [Candidatus Competibacter sp.]